MPGRRLGGHFPNRVSSDLELRLIFADEKGLHAGRVGWNTRQAKKFHLRVFYQLRFD
jgi:hypothetical protein